MSQPLLSTPDAVIYELAKWHFELLCEGNPADPVCPTRAWEKSGNLKLIKLAGQPAASAQIGPPSNAPADLDTVFECAGQTVRLTPIEFARLGVAFHFGRSFSMLDVLAEDFAQMLAEKGPRETIIQLKGSAGEVMD
jgi:hypothetical protein